MQQYKKNSRCIQRVKRRSVRIGDPCRKNMDIRKRLKGLVAMAICLTVLAGMSLPVNAAGMTYQIEDLTSGMVIEAGSTITGTTAANSLGTGTSGGIRLFIDGVQQHGSDPVDSDYYGSFSISQEYKVISNTQEAGNTDEKRFWTLNLATITASAASSSPCDHDYQWVVYQEPTSTEDGLEAYQCSKCKNITAWQKLSASGVFFSETYQKIKDAKAGSTVVIDTPIFSSVNKAVFDEIKARPDVTVTFRFYAKGHVHQQFSIPAGTDLNKVSDAPYYGFEYLKCIAPQTIQNID